MRREYVAMCGTSNEHLSDEGKLETLILAMRDIYKEIVWERWAKSEDGSLFMPAPEGEKAPFPVSEYVFRTFIEVDRINPLDAS